MSKRAQAPFLTFSLVIVACSGGSGSSTASGAPSADGGATGAAPSEPTDADGGTGATRDGTPKEACEALIACVADVDPANAGTLVTLYGDASGCWKGGAADAEACGRACEKALERYEACTTQPLDRRYVAVCDAGLGQQQRWDVTLKFDPKQGGEATFRPLPIKAATYHAADALLTQPKLTLSVNETGGYGASTTPFDMPTAAFDPFGWEDPLHVTRFAIERLRVEKGNVCSGIEGTVATPAPKNLLGACVYLPLAEGDPMPTISTASVANCTP